MSLRRANAREAASAPSVFDYPPDQPLVHVPRGALISAPSVAPSAPTPRPYNDEGIIEWREGESFWAMVLVGDSRVPTKQAGVVGWRRKMYGTSLGGLYRVQWDNTEITRDVHGADMYEMDSYDSYDQFGNFRQ